MKGVRARLLRVGVEGEVSISQNQSIGSIALLREVEVEVVTLGVDN